MQLLDVNFTMFGPDDRGDDRQGLYEYAEQLGEIAWTSDSQFYLLTWMDAIQAHTELRYVMRPLDFLKVQTVAGPFVLTGLYPPRVNELLESAHRCGLIELAGTKDAAPHLLPLWKRG